MPKKTPEKNKPFTSKSEKVIVKESYSTQAQGYNNKPNSSGYHNLLAIASVTSKLRDLGLLTPEDIVRNSSGHHNLLAIASLAPKWRKLDLTVEDIVRIVAAGSVAPEDGHNAQVEAVINREETTLPTTASGSMFFSGNHSTNVQQNLSTINDKLDTLALSSGDESSVDASNSGPHGPKC